MRGSGSVRRSVKRGSACCWANSIKTHFLEIKVIACVRSKKKKLVFVLVFMTKKRHSVKNALPMKSWQKAVANFSIEMTKMKKNNLYLMNNNDLYT